MAKTNISNLIYDLSLQKTLLRNNICQANIDYLKSGKQPAFFNEHFIDGLYFR